MIIGVAKEIKNNENRVGLTPAGTETLKKAGHTVLVEQNAAISMEISQYCYVLETGNVTFEGDPESLQSNNDIASAYLG
jgi:alanine dehydrogenase